MKEKGRWSKKPDIGRLISGILLAVIWGFALAINANETVRIMNGLCLLVGLGNIVYAFYRVPQPQPPEDVPAVERYAKALQACTDAELTSILTDALRGDEVKEAARQLLSERTREENEHVWQAI